MKGERDVKRRKRFIEALRTGLTVGAAAKVAGIGPRTPHSWVKRGDEEMRLILADAATRQVARRRGTVPAALPPQVPNLGVDRREITFEETQGLRSFGLAVLQQVAADPKAAMPARVQAAKTLCDHGERAAVRREMATRQTPQAPGPRGNGELTTEEPELTPEQAASKWRIA